MFTYVLALHNVLRWLVLLAGAVTVVLAWRGWLGRRSWTGAERGAARAFVAMLDFQFAVGLALYLFYSPITRSGFGDMGAAMRDAPVRYFLVEHPVIMVAAIAVAHVGSVKVRRAASDAERFQRAAIWFGLAFAAIAGFVPWARPMLPSF
ncbi:MAG: hypothetical protein HUU26_09745 [Gemmatimonadaceae bacterium]|nr:hypothetical protein [Gemmatimonadaceae bacterium]